MTSPHPLTPGARLLHLDATSPDALIRSFERGLPVETVDHLSQALGEPQASTLKLMRLSPRTLARRRTERTLSPEESERAARLARVIERTHDTYGQAAGNRWLRAALPALGGQTPLEYARTDLGAELVLDLISASEEGVFV